MTGRYWTVVQHQRWPVRVHSGRIKRRKRKTALPSGPMSRRSFFWQNTGRLAPSLDYETVELQLAPW